MCRLIPDREPSSAGDEKTARGSAIGKVAVPSGVKLVTAVVAPTLEVADWLSIVAVTFTIVASTCVAVVKPEAHEVASA